MVRMTQDEVKVAAGLISAEVSEEMVQYLLDAWKELDDRDWVWPAVERVVRHARYWLADDRPMSRYTGMIVRQLLYNNQVAPADSATLLQALCRPEVNVQAAVCLGMLMVERTVHERGFAITCWEPSRTCGLMTPRICIQGCKGCDLCKVDCECSPLREVP